jgi:putative phosphoribosyl transferase
MYFASRVQAGRMLAAKLIPKYLNTKSVVLVLDDGGAVVGAQVAKALGCPLMLLSSAEIMLPREPMAIAGITDSGTFTYNRGYSEGEIDEMVSEYFNLIEQEKLTEMHVLNHMQGMAHTTDKALIKKRNVILVSDGLKSGFKIDLAAEFLKPIEMGKLVVAVPFASVRAVDRMHVLADDLYCLSVIAEYIDTDHYYDTQDVPDHDTVLKTIEQVVENWK